MRKDAGVDGEIDAVRASPHPTVLYFRSSLARRRSRPVATAIYGADFVPDKTLPSPSVESSRDT